MKPTKEQYEQAVKIAADRGKEDGENAASWWEQDAIGGRVSAARAKETADYVLQGLEDGDPEILDALPSADLSGQWAGSLTGPVLVVDCWAEVGIEDEGYDALAAEDEDISTEICDAYSMAFNDAAQDAISAACRELLEEEEFVHLLLLPGGEIACGDGPGMLVPQTDINRVTCHECIEFHENEEDLEDEQP